MNLPRDAFPCPHCGEWLLPPVCCCHRTHALNAACAACGAIFVIEFGRDRRTRRVPEPEDGWQWPEEATTLMMARP